jgi:hypothetical protein
MSKYLVDHFSITPENFSSSFDDFRKVKCLYIPSKGSPQVLYDEPSVLKKNVFPSKEYIHCLPLHPFYHMYVDQVDQIHYKITNQVATYIYRYSLQTFLGLNSIVTINGDSLIFGSVSSKNQDNYDVDYSVPYELVEQVSRYYDNGIVT